MRPRLLTLFVYCLLLPAAHRAAAVPIVIPANRVASALRTDAPTGICTTSVHVTNDAALTRVTDAALYLDQAVGQSIVDDKITFRYNTFNFHNSDPAAVTDFPSPAALPFTNQQGTPKLGNDKDIAMRVRGYVNIKHAGTYTFAVLADDGYSLSIAGTPVLASSTTNQSVRDSKQVQFAAAGLYAIQMIYFKATGPAVLDLAVSLRADVEVNAFPQSLGPNFVLADTATPLYTAAAGISDCTECPGTPGDTTCGANKVCLSMVCRDVTCGDGLVSPPEECDNGMNVAGSHMSGP